MNFNSEIKQTPKPRKPNLGLFQQQTSQIYRYNQENNQKKSRLSYSPLKVPLQSAISKVIQNLNQKQQLKRTTGNFNLVTPKSHTSSSRNIYTKSTKRFSPMQDTQQSLDDRAVLQRIHSQASEFLKKYFNGYSSKSIPIKAFIECLMKQFSKLWVDTQARAIMPQFIQKLSNTLGLQYVQLNRLHVLTKQNGLIGLILTIFRQLKYQQQQYEQTQSNASKGQSYHFSRYVNESKQYETGELHNLKNIIQQFVQSLYKSMQNELYNKFNSEMRRLTLKFKETQSLLKTINQRINQNIDKISYGKKKSQLQKIYESNIQKLNQKIKQLEIELQKQSSNSKLINAENQRYHIQNKKLSETLQKFQNYFLSTNPKVSNPHEQIKTIPLQQKYRSNTIQTNPLNYISPSIPSPIRGGNQYSQIAYQNIQNITTPTISNPGQNAQNYYNGTQMTQRFVSNPTQFQKNSMPQTNIHYISGNPVIQRSSNINEDYNNKRGIVTTLTQKQNSITQTQSTRPTTPCKLNMNKPLSSPNNILKAKKA